MKTLYLDTSSSFLYCAILEEENIIATVSEKLGNSLSILTLPKIEELLNNNNINIEEINKIVACNGPGSFTGIRIGLTIAKTISWAKKIPIVLISSLEAMALSSLSYDYVVPSIDARRNYVYASVFDKKNNSFIMNEKYVSLDTLEIVLDNLDGSICYISNDDIKTDYDLQPYIPDFKRIIEFVKDREPVNPHLVDANYLKITEAEENFLKSIND